MTAGASATSKGGEVYAWLIGQGDNVGDSVLRREYVRMLRARGPVHAYVGNVDNAFVDGLELRAGETAEASFTRWLRSIRAARRRGARVTIALNAGEFAISRLFAAMAVGILLVAPGVRRAGGTVVWLGAAVPDSGRRWLLPVFRRLFRTADLVMWRDSRTSANLAPAAVMPDWAFAAGTGSTVGDRGTLGISLRFDREPPTAEWVAAVSRLAQRLELEPVVLAQVKRDSPRAIELARALDGRAVPYHEGSHSHQERVVRSEYQRMSVILSDRLHGLIMAATEGAVPLAWCEQTTGKIARHFDVVDLSWVVLPPSEVIDGLDRLDRVRVDALRLDLARSTAVARTRLDEVGRQLAAV